MQLTRRSLPRPGSHTGRVRPNAQPPSSGQSGSTPGLGGPGRGSGGQGGSCPGSGGLRGSSGGQSGSRSGVGGASTPCSRRVVMRQESQKVKVHSSVRPDRAETLRPCRDRRNTSETGSSGYKRPVSVEKSKTADLRVFTLKSALVTGVERAGLEPATSGLQSRRSPASTSSYNQYSCRSPDMCNKTRSAPSGRRTWRTRRRLPSC
jgi:hypothetical protein